MMTKTYHLMCVLLVAVLSYSSLKAPVATVTIKVTKLKSSKGEVLISLFNNKVDFPVNAEKAVRKGKTEIVRGEAVLLFSNLPYGNYAAAILHDENSNLKMDFNFLGIPQEGYGFSNNARGLFGPPSFNKASFIVNTAEPTLVIEVSYFLK